MILAQEQAIHGGQVVAQGELHEIKKVTIPLPQIISLEATVVNENLQRKHVEIYLSKFFGANENNLKDFYLIFPLGVITVVTGVLDLEKSTFVGDIIKCYLTNHFYKSKPKLAKHHQQN